MARARFQDRPQPLHALAALSVRKRLLTGTLFFRPPMRNAISQLQERQRCEEYSDAAQAHRDVSAGHISLSRIERRIRPYAARLVGKRTHTSATSGGRSAPCPCSAAEGDSNDF